MSGGPGEHAARPFLMTTSPSTDPGHTCGAPSGDGPRVGGVRIDVLTWPAFFDRLDAFLACGRGHVLHYLAADPTVVARE